MKKRFITIIKRYYSGPESWSCIHTWNRLQILLRKASLISACLARFSTGNEVIKHQSHGAGCREITFPGRILGLSSILCKVYL